jgi:hypothetical protein
MGGWWHLNQTAIRSNLDSLKQTCLQMTLSAIAFQRFRFQ